MKVAVYDRNWSTAGGGEKVAGAIAEVLSRDHDVYLLGHKPIDIPLLEERLDLDLGSVQTEIFEDTGSGSLATATQSYDLLVNCSHLSADANGARAGIYYVLFPTPFDHHLGGLQKAAIKLFGPLVRPGNVRLDWGTGFHLPERHRFRRFRWTSGDSHFFVGAPTGANTDVHLMLSSFRPEGLGPAKVEVELDNVKAAELEVGAKAAKVELLVEGRGFKHPSKISIKSDVFIPAELAGGSDRRKLGVQLLSVRLGHRLGSRLAAAVPVLATPPVSLAFLDTYNTIVSDSRFTQTWVSRLWEHESDLLYPPVTPLSVGTKDQIILSVGRFFGRKHGHSKKQLEMVRTFKKLCRSGLTGWEYHLVGGVQEDHQEYLTQIMQEAKGLPVFIHVDADGEKLRDLYSRASIFWHATGFGEDPERSPHLMEHFGIATVEAMSAGAVPIVIARGGQPEIVQDGASGLLFTSLDELASHTLRVIEDPALRKELSEAAIRRGRDFAMDHFTAELNRIVANATGVATP